jgi:hypothetical protein
MCFDCEYPVVFSLYYLVGNEKLDGLTPYLHITGNQYFFLLTIYCIGYVI